MSAHTCDACVVSCIDFRLQEHIRLWTDKNLAGQTFDFVSLAGSAGNLEAVISQIEISVRLHKVKRIILINHEDCGAYGAESTFQKHAWDLKTARRTILEKYPNLEVSLYCLHLDGKFEEVN